ncbi:hypothetical protein ABT173_15285 [Streptomyces sp. NPDC001795]|uniref:hypothetical protein n=1 Tax=Streptomyces sp. NPDC001795 TaxID=3154525 RepID=UPI003327CE9B
MTLPAALPFTGAALRAMRTAAGRRALHLALLVGGLFALGLLCGEQAQAADGTPAASTAPAAPGATAGAVRPVGEAVHRIEGTVSSAAGQALQSAAPQATAHGVRPSAPVGPPAHRKLPAPSSGRHAAALSGALGAPAAPAAPVTSVTGTVPALSDTVRKVVRPVADGLVRPVGERVDRPVGGLVQTVTEGLADPSAQWPSLPSLPCLPGLAGVPGLPGLPTSPVHTVPAPSAPQQPGAGTERQGTVEQRETAAYGPLLTGAAGATAEEYAHRASHLVPTAQPPRHEAPDGDPTGVFGGQPATDGGSPGHGDGHAVASNHRAPLRLVPGATAVVTVDGTRDRHRDIPEFPG